MKITRLRTKEILQLAIDADAEIWRYLGAKENSYEQMASVSAQARKAALMDVLGYLEMSYDEQSKLNDYIEKRGMEKNLEETASQRAKMQSELRAACDDNVGIKELMLEIQVDTHPNPYDDLEDYLRETSWELKELRHEVRDHCKNGKCKLTFCPIYRTISVSQTTYDLATTKLELHLVDTCILACETYLNDLNDLNLEYFTVDEINKELVRLQALYLDEMEGEYEVIYTMNTIEETYLDLTN